MISLRWNKVFIKGIETQFLISENGDLYNKKTKNHLKKRVTNSGYISYTLSLGNKRSAKCYAHRLVLENFCPVEGMKELQVNHKDGVKTNNQLLNLEWVTRKENMAHAVKNRLLSSTKEIEIYDKELQLVGTYASITEGAKAIGVTTGEVSDVLRGRNKHSHFYQARYKGEGRPLYDPKTLKKSHAKVVCLSLDGDFIKSYSSISDACQDMKKVNNGDISRCCKGKAKTAYGYRWLYEEEYLSQSIKK